MKRLLFPLLLLLPLVAAAQDFRSWSATPPMGWNSWDCYGPTVTEAEVKANADYMAEHLAAYGWEYVVVDIRWFVANDKAGGYNQTDPVYVLDEYGRYLPAENRFPSAAGGAGFKPLADYVHGKGLKFGIHIMRGIPRQAVVRHTPVKGAPGITADQIFSPGEPCQWLRDNYTVDMTRPGAQAYYDSLLELYASWGVDFIKCDDLSAPIYHAAEIEALRKAIDACGRPVVLSTSPGKTPVEVAEHVSAHANMWRMVDDVWDQWWYIPHLVEVAEGWYPWIGNGTWPDCDMIPLGRISIRGERGEERQSRLTKEEQYTLMTLFTIFRSPLMFGGDLPSLDPFTLKLLTNPEVLRMHRESGRVRQRFHRADGLVVIDSDNMRTGEHYLAVLNLGEEPVKVSLRELQVKGRPLNLWTGVRIPRSLTLPPHASCLMAYPD